MKKINLRFRNGTFGNFKESSAAMCPSFVEASTQQTDHEEMDDTLGTAPREWHGQAVRYFSFSTSGDQEKHGSML